MENDPKHIKSPIQRLLVLIPSFIEHQIALLKLSIAEVTISGLNKLLNGMFVLLFGSFILLFLSIACALWIGKSLDNYALGFLTIALFYFIVMIAVLFIIKPILTKSIFKSIIDALDNENEH